jgi:hypothetical protein
LAREESNLPALPTFGFVRGESMRRRFVLAAVLLLFLPCRASAGKDVYILGGVSLANLGGDAELFGQALAATLESQAGGSWTSDKKMRSGFDFGLGFGYSKDSPWGAAGEVHYVQRGAKWDLAEVTGSGILLHTTMKLDYVEIPLLLRVTSQSTAKTRPFFVLGPVLGIRASSKFEVSGFGSASSQDLSGMKSTYWAGLIGAGAQIRLGERSALLLQARYQLGFSNLVDDPTFSTKPQDFAFLAGYSKGF